MVLTAYFVLPTAHSQEFERTVIDANFPGAYQVEVADVNGDKKLDIVAVGGGTCAWYENPTWQKRIVTGGKQTPGIISSATADIDADGKAEIAIAYEFAMNTPATGKLLLAVQGRGVEDSWKLVPIADIGSIHRLRWGDINGDKHLDLVVAPIFGPKAKAPAYTIPHAWSSLTARATSWPAVQSRPLAERPVIHAIEVADDTGTGKSNVLTADNLGVGRVQSRPDWSRFRDRFGCWRFGMSQTRLQRDPPGSIPGRYAVSGDHRTVARQPGRGVSRREAAKSSR